MKEGGEDIQVFRSELLPLKGLAGAQLKEEVCLGKICRPDSREASR